MLIFYMNLNLYGQVEIFVHQLNCETKTIVELSNTDYTSEQVNTETIVFKINTPIEPTSFDFLIDTVSIMFERFWVTPKTKRLDFYLSKCHAYRFYLSDPDVINREGRANMIYNKYLREKVSSREEYLQLYTPHYINYIEENPTSFLSLSYLVYLETDKATKSELLGLLEPSFKDYADYQKIANSIQYERYPDLGEKIMEAPTVNLQGEKWTFRKLENQAFVLFFLISGCAGCSKIFPEVNRLNEKYATKRVPIVYYSLDEDQATWESSSKSQNIISSNNISELQGWSGILPLSLAVKGSPYFVIVNQQHQVEQIIFGSEVFLVAEEIEKLIGN